MVWKFFSVQDVVEEGDGGARLEVLLDGEGR